MKPDELITRLDAACRPLITAYATDLDIDSRFLRENPGVPFLHFTRANGTHIIMLPAAESPLFPPAGVLVDYLLGRADREHILKDSLSLADYEFPFLRAVHHFDGTALRLIDQPRAITIAKEHRSKVLAEWNRYLHPQYRLAA